MNDGLISTLGFIAGMSGAVDQKKLILIAASAEILAGTMSMSVGAYISIKSQREFFEAEIERERSEVENEPEIEREELREIYQKKGFNKKETEMIVSKLTSSKELWVNTMMEEELHLFPDRFDKPHKAAYFIGIAFIAGSLIPALPVIFVHNDHYLFVSIAVSIIGLFGLGAGKSSITTKSWIKSGTEMALFGIGASAFCYLIGYAFSLIS